MKTARTKVLGNLPRMVIIFACLLFLVSVFLPLLSVTYHFGWFDEDLFHITYWSYKDEYLVLRGGSTHIAHWFDTYWFAERKTPLSYMPPPTLGISWALIVMFLTEILTLTLGFVTLFLRRKLAKLLPLIPCLFTIFLMIYVSIQVQNWYANPQTYGLMKYELGFWLCIFSAFLFLLAFYIHKKEKKVKESAKDNISAEADMDQ